MRFTFFAMAVAGKIAPESGTPDPDFAFAIAGKFADARLRRFRRV